MRKLNVLLLCSALMLSACATAIPPSSRVSEALVIATKPSPLKSVAYTYQSRVIDGGIMPCGKDSRNPLSGHPGYTHTESALLDKMLSQYLTMKFSSLGNKGECDVKVTLKDFWIEQYSPDSTGRQILAALGGGETNISVVANLDLEYEILVGERSVIKRARISEDSSYVQGYSTGTSTSRLYRGKDSIAYAISDAINAANNKALAVLNSFLESEKI